MTTISSGNVLQKHLRTANVKITLSESACGQGKSK